MSDRSVSDAVPHIVSESIDIDAPPATVFAILADPREHPRIDGSGSVRGSIRGPDRLVRGSEFGVDMRLFGLPYKTRNRVVEYEPDRRIAWRHFAGHRWRYQLEPTASGGTTVTESFDYSMLPTPGRLFLQLVRFPARNREGIAATLPRLKAAAEGDR